MLRHFTKKGMENRVLKLIMHTTVHFVKFYGQRLFIFFFLSSYVTRLSITGY